MKKECLNCKWLKLDDIDSGVCRIVKGRKAVRPLVKTTDTCDGWLDAGPQYHIRMGWIKNQEKKA